MVTGGFQGGSMMKATLSSWSKIKDSNSMATCKNVVKMATWSHLLNTFHNKCEVIWEFFFHLLSIIILPFYFPPNEDSLTLDILVSAFYADVWAYKEFEGIRESYTNEMPNRDKYNKRCFAFCLLIYCSQRQVKVVFCYGIMTLASLVSKC